MTADGGFSLTGWDASNTRKINRKQSIGVPRGNTPLSDALGLGQQDLLLSRQDVVWQRNRPRHGENYHTHYSTMEITTKLLQANMANKSCWGILADRVGRVEHAED